METDSELSLLLATESVRTTYDSSETVLPLSNTVLRQSLVKSRVRLTLKGHDNQVHSAAYSPDGARIVTAGDMTAKVWNAVTGKELMTLTLVIWVESGQWHYSADGACIVTASGDRTAKVWDANTGHDSGVDSAVYSPNDARIVTAGDKTAKVWDAETGQELLTLKSHDGSVISAVYSPDGKRIAAAGSDGIFQIYTTDMEELLQIAKSRVTRQLTAEEKERYGVLGLN